MAGSWPQCGGMVTATTAAASKSKATTPCYPFSNGRLWLKPRKRAGQTIDHTVGTLINVWDIGGQQCTPKSPGVIAILSIQLVSQFCCCRSHRGIHWNPLLKVLNRCPRPLLLSWVYHVCLCRRPIRQQQDFGPKRSACGRQSTLMRHTFEIILNFMYTQVCTL